MWSTEADSEGTDRPARDCATAGSAAPTLPFRDRAVAGRELAARLQALHLASPVVIALPRGGVAVGAEVAKDLGGTLDVLLARKIGAPDRPELGVGALAEGGTAVFDEAILHRLGLRPSDMEGIVAAEEAELSRRVAAYRGARPMTSVTGRDVVVVDDGLATGGTARVALRTIRRGEPSYLVLAAPVGATETVEALGAEADSAVVLACPREFRAVGQWYQSFAQLTDEDVVSMLAELAAR